MEPQESTIIDQALMDHTCQTKMNLLTDWTPSKNVLRGRKTLPRRLLKAEIRQKLHQLLDTEMIRQIEEAFNERTFDETSFRELLAENFNIDYEDDEFALLFMQMNSKGTGFLTFAEFISFLVNGFVEEDFRQENSSKTDVLPITALPKMYKSYHRFPISKICFSPAILPDSSLHWIGGQYLTLSKDGCINFWSIQLELQRTVYCKSSLKFQQFWATDMVALPDCSVVCVTSSERDIQFYDTTAKKFEMRVIITRMDHMVCTMRYHHHPTQKDIESKLILGDTGGNVFLIFINPITRGPFKSELRYPLRSVRWDQFSKIPGMIPHMRVMQFRRIHDDWVRQAAFYSSLNCIISIANTSKQSMYISDMSQKTIYSFNIAKGVYCMDFSNSSHIIVTGSLDCLIRVWNPFVPKKPSFVLAGHTNAVIQLLLLGEKGKKLFSLDKAKCIKIWNMHTQDCMQTLLTLPADLGERAEISTIYQPETKEVVVCSMKIAVVVVFGEQDAQETDGYTHTEAVSVILYNPLFKVLISCGLESSIISWDPFTGKRLMAIKEAHMRLNCCEWTTVEITAATLNPGFHLLLTGARDGSLKIWNFQTGTCLRKMSIGPGNEVTTVLWIKEKIFAMGWNKYITEWADFVIADGKKWDTRHTEEIFCSDVRVPESLVTCSHKGEMIYWRLETSQPYKKIIVAFPLAGVELEQFRHKEHRLSRGSVTSVSSAGTFASRMTQKSRRMIASGARAKRMALPSEPITIKALVARARRRVYADDAPHQIITVRYTSVHAVHFLQSRPTSVTVGSVAVALDNGMVQIYAHHAAGEYVAGFSAVHNPDDHVMALTSDNADEFLFTGHKFGYIKIWLIKNFAWGKRRNIYMPRYRILFPFLWTDVIQCRAKRAVRNQPLPLLCSSHRGHLEPIVQICYIDQSKIYCSASVDKSVRVWTLGGKYIGTLGTFLPWNEIPSYEPPPDYLEIKLPADIKRVASWTTLKVLNGGRAPRTVKKKVDDSTDLEKDISEMVDFYGKTLEPPFIGTNFKLPTRSHAIFDINLGKTDERIPIYKHLKVTELPQMSSRRLTPRMIADLRVTKAREVRFQ